MTDPLPTEVYHVVKGDEVADTESIVTSMARILIAARQRRLEREAEQEALN